MRLVVGRWCPPLKGLIVLPQNNLEKCFYFTTRPIDSANRQLSTQTQPPAVVISILFRACFCDVEVRRERDQHGVIKNWPRTSLLTTSMARAVSEASYKILCSFKISIQALHLYMVYENPQPKLPSQCCEWTNFSIPHVVQPCLLHLARPCRVLVV